MPLAEAAITYTAAAATLPTHRLATSATRSPRERRAFRDYAGSGRPFTAGEIRLQIKAAEDFGADGWMLWNSRNQYSSADLKS